MTLAKKFALFGGGDEVSVAIDVLNLFNNKNFKDFDGYFNNSLDANGEVIDVLLPGNGANAANLLTLPRRIQFRVGYRF